MDKGFPPHKFPSDLLRTSMALALGKIRRSTGLSRADLSRISGYSNHYLSALEKGDKLPSLQAIFSLCKALGIPVADFMREAEAFLKIETRRKPRQGFLMDADIPGASSTLGIWFPRQASDMDFRMDRKSELTLIG